MVKPNFFIIGAPKCGTTSLSEYLKSHPDIFISDPKEPHYFDFDLSPENKMTQKEYLKLFLNIDLGEKKAIGEASTHYLFSKVAISEILKFNPESKFIVMLRNPIDLVQAWHMENLYQGFERVSDFEEAWRLEPKRKMQKKKLSGAPDNKFLFYSEWGLLGRQVERLLEQAAREKILFIKFEKFISDTKSVYEEVLKFLSLPSDGKEYFPKINESKVVRNLYLQSAITFLSKWMKGISGKFDLRLKLGLHERFLRANSFVGKRQKLSREFQNELRMYYLKDIKLLESLWREDLRGWTNETNET